MQTAHESDTLNYLLYLPPNHPSGELLPLVLFLHGSGERGDDLELVKKYGLARELEYRDDFPFIGLSPQCPDDVRWMDITADIMTLLNEMIDRYPVDRRRIYLTGFSMGGQGAWVLAVEHPNVFAAVAGVSGRIPPADPDFLERLCRLKDVPVWVIHGEADDRVPAENARILAQALNECGGSARLTLYPNLGHGPTCDAFYSDPTFYTWLLSHTRP